MFGKMGECFTTENENQLVVSHTIKLNPDVIIYVPPKQLLREGWIELVDERWKPKEGEYWLVNTTCTALRSVWCNDLADNDRWDNYNCFPTKEAAESAAEQVKKLLLSLHEKKGYDIEKATISEPRLWPPGTPTCACSPIGGNGNCPCQK